MMGDTDSSFELDNLMGLRMSLENTSIKTVSAFVAAITVIITAVLAVDSRYALAEELRTTKKTYEEQLRQAKEDVAKSMAAMNLNNKYLFDQARKQRLQDELFKLDFQADGGQLKPLDRAMQQRYTQELNSIDAKWASYETR